MFKSLTFTARAFRAGLIAFVVGAGLYFDHSDSFAIAREQPAMEDGDLQPRIPDEFWGECVAPAAATTTAMRKQ